MYYGVSGALGARPTRPSESATSTSDSVRDPYEKLDAQLQTRVDAISLWGSFCQEQARNLYTFLQGRNGSVRTQNESDVVAEIQRVFDAMLGGEEKQQIGSYAAEFILTTLKNRAMTDARLVVMAQNYLDCFEDLRKQLVSYLKQIRKAIETAIAEGRTLNTTTLQLDGVQAQTRKMVEKSTACAASAFPGYQEELGKSRVEWNLTRIDALEAQATSAAMSDAAANWTQAAQDALDQAGAAAAQNDAEGAAEAAAAAAEAEAAAAAAEAEAAAAAAEAEAAASDLEQMENPPEPFPWFWVGVGVVAVAGVGTVWYLSSSKG